MAEPLPADGLDVPDDPDEAAGWDADEEDTETAALEGAPTDW